MSTTLPGAIPVFVNPTDPPDLLSTNTVLHTDQHSDANDSIIALATMIGVGSSGPLVNSVFAGTSATNSSFTNSPTLVNLTLLGSQTIGGDFAVTGALSVGGLTTLNSSVSITSGSLTFGTASSKIIPGATALLLVNNANTQTNLGITDAGVVTIRAGLVVTAGGATITAGNVAITAGNLTFGAASAKVIPGATSLLFRNTTDAATTLSITNAGVVTALAGLVATAGGVTATAGGVTITAGDLTFGGTSQKIVAPTTSLLIRDHADANTNITVLDSGATTFRALVTASGGATMGGTFTLGANTMALASGTISGQPTWSSTQNMNISGSSGSATSASTLNPGRNINGTLFDGSTNITVTADANTLTNTTLHSTVVASSLTSVGTLTALTVSGAITLTAAASKIVPGATSLALRNNGDSANNLLIADAGTATFRLGIVLSGGGVSMSGADRSVLVTDANKLLLGANNTTIITLTPSGGAQVGAPTGGDKGVGALNAVALYQQGVAVTTGGVSGGQAAASQNVAAFSTSSTSLVDITGITKTITTTGGAVLVTLGSADMILGVGVAYAAIGIKVDSTDYVLSFQFNVAAATGSDIAVGAINVVVTGLSAASHTFTGRLQVFSGAGTITINQQNIGMIGVVEFPH